MTQPIQFYPFKAVVGGLLGYLAALVGGVPFVIWVLIALMALDILTGLLSASICQEVSSKASWAGLKRKALTLCVIVASALVQLAVSDVLDVPLAAIVSGAYCITETISVLENAEKAGVPIPEQIRQVLEIARPKPIQPPEE